MFSTFSSDEASQYCIVRNHARRSCALPGMNRRIFGNRLRSRIFFAPLSVDGFDDPRNRFRNDIVPEDGAPMSSVPIRVIFTIAASEMIPTMASHSGRRASKAGRMRRICSSRNRSEVTTISATATASFAASSLSGLSPHSAAAKTETDRPGKSR